MVEFENFILLLVDKMSSNLSQRETCWNSHLQNTLHDLQVCKTFLNWFRLFLMY